MAVVDTYYYDILQVEPTATDAEIKKAYRKMAVKHHPDKNVGDEEAKQRFQEVGEAYQVLSDSSLRKRYDQFGKDQAVPEAGFEDAVDFASKIFGGDAFTDWIGELALIKDMAKLSQAMEEEEKQQEEQAQKATNTNTAGGADSSATMWRSPDHPNVLFISHDDSSVPADAAADSKTGYKAGTQGDTRARPDSHVTTHAKDAKEAERLARREQEKIKREQLKKLEQESQETREKRVDDLAKKLLEKISVWTETSKADDITRSFQQKMQYEADELKMESFGIELLHTIGNIYYTRAVTFVKSHKSFLGLGGFWSRVKERGSMVKDGWNTISTALDAQNSLKDLTITDDMALEEQAEVQETIMGKVLVAFWAGSKFEVQSILREVSDRVLYDKKVSVVKRLERAQAMMIIGRIFQATKRTEEENAELQMFEQLVANATMKKRKRKPKASS